MNRTKRTEKTRAGCPPSGAGLPASQGRLALGLALLALLIRAVYLLESGDNPFRLHLDLDPEIYDQWARSILGGTPFGPGPFRQAPLYPYFLALIYAVFGAHTGPVLWVQAVLGAATTYLGARVAGRYWGRAGLLATGLMLALYKPAIFYTGVLLVPVLASLLLAGALHAAPRRGLVAGLLVGAATLAHPVMLPAGLVATTGMVLHDARDSRSRPRRLVPLLLGVVLGILPATIHNLAVSGRLVPISVNAGINLYIGNGPNANGFYNAPYGFRAEADQLGIGEASRLAGRPLNEVEASRFWTRKAVHAVSEDPGRVVRLYFRKLLFTLSAYETPQVESLDFEKRYSALMRLPVLPNWIALLALAGGAIILRRRDPIPRVLAGGVLATALLIAIFFATGRFRLPMHVLLALAGGAGIASIPRSRSRLLPAAAAAVAILVLFAPNWLRVARDLTHGQQLYRLGVIAEGEGRAEEARRLYTEALAIDPHVARAAINLGIMEARQRDLESAERLLERGVALDPRSARGLLALGQIHQIRNNLEAACDLYRRAWEADSSFTPSLESLATGRYLQGRLPEAEAHAMRLLRLRGQGAPGTSRCAFFLSRLGERRRNGWPPWTSRARAEGDLAFSVGKLPEAVRWYRRAVEIDPGDLAALLELARLAAMHRDEEAGGTWRQRFLDQGGESEIIEQLSP